MKSVLSQIRPTAPLIYAATRGLVADLWTVETSGVAKGDYIAKDPRFVIVLDPQPSPLCLQAEGQAEPIAARAAFIPALVPIRSHITEPSAFSHLDLHFNTRHLATQIKEFGGDPTCIADQPIILEENPGIRVMAEVLAEDIRSGTSDPLLLESLAFSIAAKILLTQPMPPSEEPVRGGLTQEQLTHVDRLMRTEMHRRLPVAEMAEKAGLSESWFAHAYRKTRGETPHRALQAIRVDTAQRLLVENQYSIADVAAMVGFADQAHLTRAFRSMTGQTPGHWRRISSSEQNGTIPDSFSQDFAE